MPKLDWTVLVEFWSHLVDGLIATVQLTALCVVVSAVAGLLIAIGRIYAPRPISSVCAVYTELFRNIPPLVQLFFWFFATGLSVLEAAVVGLSVFNSAYIAETIRSGISSIPKTQMEASRSAGLTAFQAVTRIILPQALIRTTPIFSNQFIAIIKDTSVAMTIGYAELTYQTQLIESLTFRGFEAAIIATILYVALACIVILGMHQVDRLLRVNVRRG